MQEKRKTYSKPEEFASAGSHILGIIITILCVSHLFTSQPRGVQIVGVIIYALTLILMFTTSSCYHIVKSDQAKLVCRRCDHCAIYLLIAGTYTPVLIGGYGGANSLLYFTAIWAVAIIGVILKAFFGARLHVIHVILYVILGWSILFFAKEAWNNLPYDSLRWLLIGGVSYTVGVIFYASRFPFAHAIWHIFVLIGGFAQFTAIVKLLR